MIEALRQPVSEADLRGLAEVLVDGVDAGGSLSFLPPLGEDEALRYWRESIAAADPRAVVIVARDAEGIAGAVRLAPVWAPNQQDRAHLEKLVVHRRARRKGLARELVRGLEQHAAQAGFRMLTLEARRHDFAEQLYQSLGWIPCGIVPRDCLEPDGSRSDTVVYYRELAPAS
jgi:acetyltransferase